MSVIQSTPGLPLEGERLTTRTTRLIRVTLPAALLLGVVALAAGPLAARQTARAPRALPFDVQDVMIAARDGVRLHTKIFVPKGAQAPLPFVFRRTPYGVDDAGAGLSGPL